MNLNSEHNYKAYFQSLATSHQDVGYFRFGDEKDKHVNQRSGAQAGILLWLDYYQPIQLAGEQDNFLGVVIADLTVMQASSDKKDDLVQQQAKYLACEEIIQQILARVAYDYQQDTLENTPLWQRARFGRMTDQSYGGTMYVGCTCELPFHVPLKMEYNPAKWT